LLGNDYSPLHVYTTQYLIDGASLNLVVADADKNIQFYRYLPHRAESYMGKKLISQADFHIGAHITKLIPLIVKHNLPPLLGNPLGSDALPTSDFANNLPPPRRPFDQDHPMKFTKKPFQTMLLGGTLDGGLVLVSPIDESVYRRLYSLHTHITYNLQHVAGLNPRAFRLYQSPPGEHTHFRKNIVDGELLLQYYGLDIWLQRRLARDIGTSSDQIIDNLLQQQFRTNLFH